MNSRDNGFTLIELLVVIAILSILASAVFAAINPQQLLNRASDAKAKNAISQCAHALEIWHIRNAPDYPEHLNVMVPMKDLKQIPSGCDRYATNTDGSQAWIAATLIADPMQYGCDINAQNVHWCYQTTTSQSGYVCDGANIFNSYLVGTESCEEIASTALNGIWIPR